MSSNLNSTKDRCNALELKGDQAMATDEQIREHCPELFDKTFYLNRLARVLEDIKFGSEGVLGSHLDEENQQKLDACVSHLTEVIKKTISEIPFEFTVQQVSDDTEELHVIQNRDFTVAVGNAEALLESVKQPLENLEVLHDVSDLVSKLEKRLVELKESLANPNPREVRTIERSEIEISVLEAELKDFEEFEETGKLTAHHRNQKKKFEDDLEKHSGIIRKIKTKTKNKKERIVFTQETLDQVVQIFTEFLAQHNPEAPVDFSTELDLTKVFTDNRIDTDLVSAELTEVLQAERPGSYTVYYPEVESQMRADERKKMLKKFRGRFMKWAPVGAFCLLAVGTAYFKRDAIKTLFSSHHKPSIHEVYKSIVDKKGSEEAERLFIKELAVMLESKDAFVQFASSLLSVDERLDSYLAKHFSHEQAELLARKLRIFQSTNLSDADSDLIFYSNSIAEIDQNFRSIEDRNHSEKKNSPEVESFREKILNNPFINKYVSQPHRDHFGVQHTLADIKDYFVDVLKELKLNKKAQEDIDSIFSKHEPNLIYEYAEDEEKEVAIRLNEGLAAELSSFFGDDFEVRMVMERQRVNMSAQLPNRSTVKNLCNFVEDEIILAVVFSGEYDLEVYRRSVWVSAQRAAIEREYCTDEQLFKFEEDSRPEMFMKYYGDNQRLALLKSALFKNESILSALSNERRRKVLKAKSEEEFVGDLIHSFPIKTTLLGNGLLALHLDPMAYNVVRHLYGENTVLSYHDGVGDYMERPEEISKKIVNINKFCGDNGAITLMVFIMGADSRLVRAMMLIINAPEVLEQYCSKGRKKKRISGDVIHYNDLVKKVNKELEADETKELASAKLEVINHHFLSSYMSKADKYLVLLSGTISNLKSALTSVIAKIGRIEASYDFDTIVHTESTKIIKISKEYDQESNSLYNVSVHSRAIKDLKKQYGDDIAIYVWALNQGEPNQTAARAVVIKGVIPNMRKSIQLSSFDLCAGKRALYLTVLIDIPVINSYLKISSSTFDMNNPNSSYCKESL